jgi:hypothetical protein
MSSHVADRPVIARRHASRRGAGLAVPAALAAAAGSLAMAVVGYVAATPGHMNGLGLIDALPVVSLVGLGGLVTTFVLSLHSSGIPARWLYVQLVLLVSALALAPALIEPNPRFATAWQHAGFAEYIARSHHILAHTDARFSWPAFFAAAGLFAQSVGVQPLDLLRFTPLLLDLAYLVPFAVIAAHFLPRPRQRVLAAFFFAVGNWVGQDYFSPQGLNLLLYLAALAALLRFLSWGDVHPRWASPARRLLRLQDTSPPSGTAAADKPVAGLVLVVVIYTAATVSHQLTPYFILFATATLVVLGVCKAKWLPLLMLCITVAYFVWGAQDFWSGHLSELLRAIGSFGTSINEGLVARSGASDPAHETVILARLALPVLYALLGLVGLLRCRSTRLLPAAFLAVVPMLVLGLQSYGGEAILRCFLFGLPFFSILATQVWGGTNADRVPVVPGRASVLTRALLAIVLVAGVVVARYGNEAFEQMRPADVRVVQAAYQIAPPGATLITLTESVPWRSRDIERYEYDYASPIPLDAQQLPLLLAQMRAVKRRAYLILTNSQWDELRYYHGLSPQRLDEVQRLIVDDPSIIPVYREGNVGVFVLSRNSP